MRRSSRIVVVALAAVSALAFLLWKKGPWREKNADPSSELAAPPRGRQAVLRVAWHEKSTARLPKGEAAGLAETIPGELDLDADLVLARETTTNGDDAVKAELRDVRSAHVVVSGQEVLGQTAAKSLEGRPVHLVLDGGRIARVLVDKDAPSLAVQLTESVARQVLLLRPHAGQASFERDEETPAGTMKVHYERKGDAYTRAIVGAVSVAGLPDRCDGPCSIRARSEGEVRFDEEEGTIVRLGDKRDIRAGAPGIPAILETTASFEAKRVMEGAGDDGVLDAKNLASKLPGEPFENAADKRAALTRRAAGASIEDILGGISTAASSGAQGLPRGWLVRSTALLELEPKLLAEVAIRFEDDGIGSAGRLALLDLLASTSGDEAKATLLKVLDGPAARQDDLRLAFVQRMMLVEEPSGDMARALRERLGRSQGSGDAEMAYAEAHVLGAMAGRLSARGGKGEAKASIDALAGALDGAKTPASRSAYISALGNAGDPAQVSRIAKHSADADASVRRAVASALRKTNEPAARSTLLTLAKDPNEDVQVAAVDSLGHQPITSSEQGELTQLLDGSHLGGEAEGQVVTLLLRQGPPSPEVRSSLAHVMERTGDPRLAARVRFALESTAAAN